MPEIDFTGIPDKKAKAPPLGVDLSAIPDAAPMPDLHEDSIHSEVLGITVGDAAESRDAIRQALKDRANSFKVEKERTKQLETGARNGSYGALVPYLGLSAFKGLTDIVWKPLGEITGIRTDKLIDDALRNESDHNIPKEFIDKIKEIQITD